MANGDNSKNLPRLTVVTIATRANFLTELQLSLDKSTYPQDKLDRIVVPNWDKKLSIGKAFNQGARQATSNLVYFVSDDNELPSYSLGALSDEMVRTQYRYDRVCGYMNLIDDNSTIIGRYLHPEPGLWQLSSFWKFGGFDETLKIAVDTKFIRHCALNGLTTRAIPEYILNYRLHRDQVNKHEFLKEMVYKKFYWECKVLNYTIRGFSNEPVKSYTTILMPAIGNGEPGNPIKPKYELRDWGLPKMEYKNNPQILFYDGVDLPKHPLRKRITAWFKGEELPYAHVDIVILIRNLPESIKAQVLRLPDVKQIPNLPELINIWESRKERILDVMVYGRENRS